MKIFDMHTHSGNIQPNPKQLIEKMEAAGVYGGCVFSCEPKNNIVDAEAAEKYNMPFKKRLEKVLEWTKGYEDRLFPILWIHPDEENIIENIKEAADAGICGFKMICNNFYVYEEKCMNLLREIAKLNKPVIFHSGILWDGGVSSKYNRPLNWEALVEIEGLRFSMGHCSWPWTDECIAMYGKFLNALTTRNSAEMFFDITPGTPKVYREDLLKKLYLSGYDVGNNVMFGTDGNANDYNSKWASDWLEFDGKIMDELGISKANIEALYYGNLMRFLGKSKEKVSHVSPVPDNADTWNPYNMAVNEIITKWYKKLGFRSKYDDEFFESLENIKISDAVSINTYNIKEKSGKRNLLSFLFMCEELSVKYMEKGISEGILIDTLKDLVRWTWEDSNGEFALHELGWLKNHMSMKLFKLGRLQFCMGSKNNLEIHIPEEGPLDISECKKSIEMAKEFFGKYFPEFRYDHFSCSSWLLDQSLEEILNENSNIIKFQQMFDITSQKKSDDLLGYIFKWKADREDINNCVCKSGFAKKVKERIENGGDFFSGYGIIEK